MITAHYVNYIAETAALFIYKWYKSVCFNIMILFYMQKIISYKKTTSQANERRHIHTKEAT